MIGKNLSHYRILDELGRGGMGVVYKAIDVNLDRTVAIKVLKSELSLESDAKARFIQEAKSASALDNNNIGVVFEIDETRDRQLFIAMGYYSGGTLKEKIVPEGLPVNEALGYAAQIASGLSAAHKTGIIHRDIKPENIMVTEDDVLKIVDFGLAKVAGVDVTKTGSTVGTIAYMSPEQARGEHVNQGTDIWSLGAILYELLTGARPFKAEYEAAMIYQVLNEDPEPLTSVRSDIPDSVRLLVSKALEKNVEKRYGNVNDLLDDLQTAMLWPAEGPVVEKEAPITDPKTTRSSSHHRVVTPERPISGIDTVEQTNLMILLNKVHQFWIEGVLEKSVYGEAALSLGIETDAAAVEHPWEQILELPDRARRTLSSDQRIGGIFEEVGRSLLILGAPGSGKTISLLELARDLIAIADEDPTQPVPVVFNLSSLAARRLPLIDWLTQELSAKYHVPKKMGRSWLEQNRLALLLDGLDEVNPEYQAPCVNSINEYVEEYGVPGLVVCSRIEDYTALPVRLKLFAAIRLQPLSEQQVLDYIASSGDSLAGLYAVMRTEANLR